MICTLRWGFFSTIDWDSHYKNTRRANLLQSADYADAMHMLHRQRSLQAIIEIDEQPAGIVHALETGLFYKTLHAIMIDRGPLWFDGYGSDTHFEAFLSALNKDFPARLGRKRRFIPETENTPKLRQMLEANGWRTKNAAPYQTIWLDLTQNTEALRAALKKNWRGSLKKSERADVDIQWDDTGAVLPWLLKVYSIDKAQRRYDGPSVKTLLALGQAFARNQNLLIGRATKDGKIIAAIMVLCHGDSATYQIGWNSPAGREVCAHHFLLWNALNHLKERGIKDFDLGGVNDKGAKGVKQFKEGLGGQLVTLPGLYS